jgi:hypothetical protein
MFQIVRMSDEGSSSEFMARLMFGVLQLREEAIRRLWPGPEFQAHRDKFDERYNAVLAAVRTARKAALDLEQLVAQHTVKVESGEIVTVQQHAVSFSEGIDSAIHDYVSRVLTQGVIALKALQAVTRIFGIEIGSVFQKQVSFERGMNRLQTAGHGALAAYLRAARSAWTQSFTSQRIAVEHDGWVAPRVRYEMTGPGRYTPVTPLICGSPAAEFGRLSVRRLQAFIENVVVYAMSTTVSGVLILVEIPRAERPQELAVRFKNALVGGGIPPWGPTYSDDDFLT